MFRLDRVGISTDFPDEMVDNVDKYRDKPKNTGLFQC
jgi:hypothetical protein